MTTKTAERSIEIIFEKGSRERVSGIPANAKITFGPMNPGAKGYPSETALRIYTSQQNQLAVFRNVATFRDLSLGIEREKVHVEKEGEDVYDANGDLKSKAKRRETRTWEVVK